MSKILLGGVVFMAVAALSISVVTDYQDNIKKEEESKTKSIASGAGVLQSYNNTDGRVLQTIKATDEQKRMLDEQWQNRYFNVNVKF